MNENQDSDSNNNNINKGAINLEEKVRIAKEEKENAETEYQEIHDRKENLKDMLKDYQEQKESIPYEYDFAIAIAIMVILTLTIATTSFLLGSLAVIFFKSSLWLGGIISLASIPAAAIIEKKLYKKLQDIFEDKIQESIINSEEYQRILVQIETIEEDLKLADVEELNKKINMRNATTNYSTALSELTMKQALLNYAKTETSSKEGQAPAPHTRKRINNRRYNRRNMD